MKRELKISYEWRLNNPEDFNQKSNQVLKRHEEFLEESAMERISEMMNDGYLSGELHDAICSCEEDQKVDGASYSGSWRVVKL